MSKYNKLKMKFFVLFLVGLFSREAMSQSVLKIIEKIGEKNLPVFINNKTPEKTVEMQGEELLFGLRKDLNKNYFITGIKNNSNLSIIVCKTIGGSGGINENYSIFIFKDGKLVDKLRIAGENGDGGFYEKMSATIFEDLKIRIQKKRYMLCDDEQSGEIREKIITDTMLCFHIVESGKIFPIIKTDYLQSEIFENISMKTKSELRLLRNYILARHGQSFYSEDLKQFFKEQIWYKEIKEKNVSESELCADEVEMLRKILILEKK